MKKLLLFSAALVLSVAAHATQGVYGSWSFPRMSAGGITFDLVMTFDHGSVAVSETCTMGANSASVQVSVPAVYTANTITTTANGQASNSVNGVNCSVQISQSMMSYVVSADDQTISLSMTGQPTMTLPRKH